MFDILTANGRKLRRLKKAVAENDRLYAPSYRAAKSEQDHWAVKGEYDAVAGEDFCKLERFKTNRLLESAEKLGVEPPTDDEHWETHPWTQIRYLSHKGTATLQRNIEYAWLTKWKDRIGVFGPVVSIVIALAALALSVFIKLSIMPCK
jgi:hypothetical protein